MGNSCVHAFLLGLLCFPFACHQEVFGEYWGQPRASDSAPDEERIWRVANQCAVNALYVMVRLHGRDARYEDLEATLPVSLQGNSLSEIRDCAARFDLKTRIVQRTPEDLRQLPLPVLVHFEEEKAVTGHYVVVTAVGPERVEHIDGTTGIIRVLPLHEFSKEWSGYALVVEEQPLWHLLFPVALVLGAGSLGLGIWLQVRQRKAAPRDRSLTANTTASPCGRPAPHLR